MRIIWDNPEFVKQILLPWYLMGRGGIKKAATTLTAYVRSINTLKKLAAAHLMQALLCPLTFAIEKLRWEVN